MNPLGNIENRFRAKSETGLARNRGNIIQTDSDSIKRN